MAEKVARVRTVEEVAPDVLVLTSECATPPELTWRAGQFISIRCGAASDKNPERRSYSISSSPTRGGSFELLVKLLPGGVGSDLFRGLAPDGELYFTGPMGFFVCELAHVGDAIFCATGTGIAAALPMIHDALARPGETGRVHLYWGMRAERELYWLDRLDAIRHPRFQATVCLSRPEGPWPGVRGRINGHVLAALPELARPVFYLVGNGDMVRDLKAGLIAAGVDRKRQIRQEIFYPETKG
jgi:CDP-4-dehydro-6-deoxyglucose reductase